MFSRKVIFFVAAIVLLILVPVFGLRFYCAQCNEELANKQVAGIACPPATQAASPGKDVPDLTIKLLRCDRHTDHKIVAGILTEIRNSGIRSAHISEILSSMLPYQAEIYQDRDKWEVLRLRAYILLTLGETGFPESAFPTLVDALAYVDERMKVVELGAAIKVVGNLGVKGSQFGESMISAYNRVFSDEEFSLKRYELSFSKDEATTVQIEIARALGNICNKKDEYAIKFLHSVLASSGEFGFDKRVKTAAQQSLNIILRRDAEKGLPFFCSWKKKRSIETSIEHSAYIEPKDRKGMIHKNISLTDHEGLKREFTSLIDRPTLLTFFYTRCENDMKCSGTIAHMALLQKHLSSLSLNNKVKLIAISLEPQHDSPALLKGYLTDRGVKLGNEAMAIALETQGHQALFKELLIPVGYNSGWVNGHGIAAVLLDKDKRVVRKYNSLLSNTSEILADFTKLLRDDGAE